MRYPQGLKPGGTIGFVAPSFGCGEEPFRTMFELAQQAFVRRGYRLDLGPNCYEEKGIGISNTPRACGEELTEWYCRKENDVLISCGGGELMCEILDYVDFEAIRQADPKWYMGYSDNTNFTFLLATLCDTAAVYGPCAAAFGMEPWHESLSDAYGILTGQVTRVSGYELWEKESKKNEENPLAPYNVTEPRKIRCFQGGREIPSEEADIQISGRLIGGCMDCLVNLMGTSYDRGAEFAKNYEEDGLIWFLESCDLNVMAIRRAVWEMKHGGWFQNVKGFLIGRPYCHGQELMGLDQYQAVLAQIEDCGVPVIMDLDLGHLPPMMPVICGACADVSVKGGQIVIEYKKE